MSNPVILSDVDVCLDIFGQQPRLNIYTQVCLCFSLCNNIPQSTVVSTLKSGLERLTASFPWVAGQIVCEGSGQGDTGLFKIKTLESIPRLSVKYLREDPRAPKMQELRSANFPMKYLDESVIAPRNTFPKQEIGEGRGSDSPVFLLQANFILGGLVLTFLGHHQAMDMVGQAQIMYLLSKACHGESFTDDELSSGNLDRRNVIPLLNGYKNGPELASHLVTPIPASAVAGESTPSLIAPPPARVWASFVFPRTSLLVLKSKALQTLSPNLRYISTDDALSAFVWQSVMRARWSRLSPTTKVTLARAVDVRRYVNVPTTYTGMIQNMTYSTYELQKLVAVSLGEISSALRVALETTDLSFHTRALATYLHGQADKSGLSPASCLDLSADIMLSSWAKTDCYNLDFNLDLGLPEAVRRPRFAPLESFVYFMPRACSGEITVVTCLREDDMERLKADPEFAEYATHVG